MGILQSVVLGCGFLYLRYKRPSPFNCLSLNSNFVSKLGDSLLVVAHALLNAAVVQLRVGENNSGKKVFFD